MRFLVDNALSPKVAHILQDRGHDAVHVRELGLSDAEDLALVEIAREQQRVLLSADADFATILALRRQAKPSFVLFRGPTRRRPQAQAEALLEALLVLEPHLESGAAVTITPDRIRIRELPVAKP